MDVDKSRKGCYSRRGAVSLGSSLASTLNSTLNNHFCPGLGLSAVVLTFLAPSNSSVFMMMSYDTTAFWHIDTNVHSIARMINDVVSCSVLRIHLYIYL